MKNHKLCFPSASSQNPGDFRLLELPQELLNLVEDASRTEQLTFYIKGQPNEDAVLCTNDKTFTLRSVTLSNSVLVVTSPSSSDIQEHGSVVLRDQLNEIIEITPTVPKIQRLRSMLKAREYNEADGFYAEGDEEEDVPKTGKRVLYEDIFAKIQASRLELDEGLKQDRILNIKGELRPIALAFLSSILEQILNCVVSSSLPYEAAPLKELTENLADDQVPIQVSTQVISWFGVIKDGKWKMDVDSVLKEVGLGILRYHRDEPITESKFLTSWKSAVGDSFEQSVFLSLLDGNYFASISPLGKSSEKVLTYFPASTLPLDPTARFSDLFLTKNRWKEEEIVPFLSDIAFGKKDRDKLLLKYARATSDSQGVWYTSRMKH